MQAELRGDRCINDDFVDFFLAFMVMCYSLRDFVVRTGGVLEDEIDELIRDCEAKRICRDVCNRAKHCAISRPSVDALIPRLRDWRAVRGGVLAVLSAVAQGAGGVLGYHPGQIEESSGECRVRR